MPPRSRPARVRTRAARQRRPAPRSRSAGSELERLVRLMAGLRDARRGCPWDLAQTHQTLRPYLIEEAYEAVDALDRGALDDLPGELGDVLLQCVFHAQLGSEAGRFTMVDVVRAINEKLVRRHPHVFTADGRLLTARAKARASVSTPGAVKEQWAAIKAREGSSTARSGVLDGLPRSLPALVRAQKIGSRVAAVGFDWAKVDEVFAKVEEEWQELRAARAEGLERLNEEFGDVLLTLSSLARHLGLDAERALALACDKFTSRFAAVERTLVEDGGSVHTAPMVDLERAWQHAKRHAPASGPAAPRPATSATGRARSPRRPPKKARR